MKKITVLSIVFACVQLLVWSEASAQNAVKVLLDGYVKPIEGRQLVPGKDENNGGRYVASTVALVKGQSAIVVVDPGFVGSRKSLLDALKKTDTHPNDVTHVFISHHHPDHTINAALFPNATIVDFWATYKNDLWEDHPDKYSIAPGIEVWRTPGHTKEDASLVVRTKQGTVVFTHVWWFRTPDGTLFPESDPIAEDQGALKASREIVYGVADCIIPGHGKPFANPKKPGATCAFSD